MMCSCYRTVSSAIWEIFSKFFIFCSLFTSLHASEILARYDKRGKYLAILHEAMCDNYFIVKCLLRSNMSRVLLLTKCIALVSYNLMLIWYKKAEAKSSSTNFTRLYFVFPIFCIFFPETLKYWVGVQRGQSYLMGRRCLFNFGWPPF